MKMLIAAVALTTCLAFVANAEDMHKYLNDTRALVEQRKYPEALDRTLWYYEHALEREPSMAGVRNSFALHYWKELGERYEPAMVALKNVREARATSIYEGKATCAEFQDAMAINRTLKENEKTIALFRHLDRLQPRVAKQCWGSVQDIALATNARDLIQRYHPDVHKQFDSVREMYSRAMSRPASPDDHLKDSLKEANTNLFVVNTLKLIEVSKILGDLDTAKDLQKKALAIRDDNRLRNAML